MESPFQSSRSEASGDLPDLADLPGGLEHFEAFYREQKLCKDWDLCWQRMRLPLPPCLRLEAEALKLLAPWQPELVPWCGAFRLHAHAVDELGHYHPELAKVLSDGQRAGKIIRQESASMLPALALGIQPEHKIVELCAAPGSKTLQILDIMQASAGSQVPSGLLVANDSKGGRLRKLIDRVRRVPASPLLVTRADARRFPQLRQHADGCPVLFDRVLCDVPCSGDGTMRKARSLLRRWTPRAGVGHHGIQLEILLQGLKLLAPKGLLAYSTCALNPVECEAVVSAALCQQPGFETVPIQVPGLQLEPGLPTWRVPALTRAATWATWHEVPEDEKASGQLRRSMFPPAAYAATAMVAGLEQQLLRCGRLLPSNDDGGCFFLALVRRKEEGTAAFSKGDRVLATAVGQQGVVRGPGTKQFRGLLRVLYDDGSQYHVAPNELLKLSPETAVEQAKPASLRPLLCAVPDDWHRIAGFFGVDLLASCLAQGSGGAICLASPSLKALAWLPESMSEKGYWAAGRPLFFKASSEAHAGNAWQPTAEAAALLAGICDRSLRLPMALFREFLSNGEVDAEAAGASAWQDGFVLVSPLPETGHGSRPEGLHRASLVGHLHSGRIRRCARAGAAPNCSLAQLWLKPT
ncbi:unnamed protein product [Effrenium voratum]|nr:unnamed protein product [Effrenium voratum]